MTITEIYDSNDEIRRKLKDLLADIPAEIAEKIPEEGKWSVANIVEHLQIVETGMLRICAKLLSKAEKNHELGDGTVIGSGKLDQKNIEFVRIKMEAPEMVRPTGTRTVAESLAAMRETRRSLDELRPMFEKFDCNIQKFPHPFFGDLSAAEWLRLIGLHELRHIRQINNLLDEQNG